MERTLFFLIGFFVFSSFSTTLLIDWLGFPIALPELLLMPFLFFLKKFNFVKLSKSYLWYVLFYLWFLLIAIALLVSNFSPFQILSFSRGFLYLFLIYSLFLKKNDFSLDNVMFLSLGSLFGWSVSSFLNLRSLISSFSGEEVLSYGALLAIPLFISISIIKKKYTLLFVGLILMISVSLTAGLRRQIFVVLVSLLLSFFFKIIKKPKTVSIFVTFSAIIVLFFYFNFGTINSFLATNAPIIHNRVIVKTLRSYEGGKTSGDIQRQSNFKVLYDDLDKYIFPRGFASKQTSEKSIIPVGRFNDFPLLLLSYIFGFPITLLLLIYFSKKALNNFKFYLKYNSDGAYVFFICYLIILLLCFLDGTFLTFIYAIPLTGYCLSRLSFYSKRINNY